MHAYAMQHLTAVLTDVARETKGTLRQGFRKVVQTVEHRLKVLNRRGARAALNLRLKGEKGSDVEPFVVSDELATAGDELLLTTAAADSGQQAPLCVPAVQLRDDLSCGLDTGQDANAVLHQRAEF